jgi:hypothetical protein
MIKIKLDKRNTNLHTDAGLQLLDKSIDKVGIIESYTISNDGVVISGNARHEKISAKITKEPIVIETDGTEAIIIKRTDIESNTKKFHEASILANTTAHKNFNLDYDVIDEIVEEFDIDIEEVGVEVVEDSVSDSDDFGTDFSLPEGDKAPFQQMTFTLADEQAEQIKNAIADIKQTEEYKYAETMGNENSNGNALYLIIMQWAEQKK